MEKSKQQKLWQICQKFITDQDITCSESIYQTDSIIESAYEFIENICELVGYNENEN